MSETATHPDNSDDERTRRSALVLQVLPVLFIPLSPMLLGLIGLLLLLGGQAPPQPVGMVPPGAVAPPTPYIPLMVMGAFCTILLLALRLRWSRVSALMLVIAALLIGTITLFGESITSNTPALLFIAICAAGLMLDGRASLVVASLATLLVFGRAWLETQGFLLSPQQVLYPPNALWVAAGFWSSLYWTIAALTSLAANHLQSVLRQSRQRAEELRKLSAELELRVATQTAQLLQQEREAAVLDERNRLAHDIHDTLAQSLTGVVLQLSAAQHLLRPVTDTAALQIELAQQLARDALDEARLSVWNLRAPQIQQRDLLDTLRSLSERVLSAVSTVQFDQYGTPGPLAPAIETTILRVAQEAFTNIARHAAASRVQVTLTYASEVVTLTIEDNGRGFNPEAQHRKVPQALEGGFGLIGMHERVAAVGGNLYIKGSPGVTITVTLPRL